MRIAIVGCCKQKASKPGRARDVYASRHFRVRLAWAEKFCDAVFIASSKLGLISPEKVIAPYDHTFSTNRSAKAPEKLGEDAVTAWGLAVAVALRARVRRGDCLIFLIGRRYYRAILAGLPGVEWESPHEARLATRTKKLVEELRSK